MNWKYLSKLIYNIEFINNNRESKVEILGASILG